MDEQKPFELTPNESKPIIPNNFTTTPEISNPNSFTLSQNKSVTEKPVQTGSKGMSIGMVILIFIAFYILDLFLCFLIFKTLSGFNINLPNEDYPRQPSSFSTETSTCQFTEYKIESKDPFKAFLDTLGYCDNTYAQNLVDSWESFSQNDFAQEKRLAENALKSANNSYQEGVAYYLIGHSLNATNQFAEAEKTVINSVQKAPNFSPSLSLLNAIYNNGKNYSAGEVYGQKCVELNPNYAFCHLNYSVSLLYNGKKDLGLAEIDKALELEPKSKSVKEFYDWAHSNYK